MAEDPECADARTVDGKIIRSPYAFYASQEATSTKQTSAFIRRNFLTAAIHGNGLLLIDLMKGDAFANPRRKNETEAFWRSLQATRKQLIVFALEERVRSSRMSLSL